MSNLIYNILYVNKNKRNRQYKNLTNNSIMDFLPQSKNTNNNLINFINIDNN